MSAGFLVRCRGLVHAHWWVELGAVPLVGRAMSGGVFSWQLCAQEDFKQLMSGAVFPPPWLFGLRHPSTVVYRLLGGIRLLGEKMAASRRAHANEYFLELPLSVFLSLQ